MSAASERVRLWRLANPGRRNVTERAHRVANRAEALKREAEFRESNREAIRDRQHRWAQEHPESTDASQRRYRESGGQAASGRRYHAAHPERHAARVRRYRGEHPDFVKTATERRRARKAAAPATLTTAEWLALLDAYGHTCAYCGEGPERLTQDHVIPLALGGGTTAENIVPACQSCNSRKGIKVWTPMAPETAR